MENATKEEICLDEIYAGLRYVYSVGKDRIPLNIKKRARMIIEALKNKKIL